MLATETMMYDDIVEVEEERDPSLNLVSPFPYDPFNRRYASGIPSNLLDTPSSDEHHPSQRQFPSIDERRPPLSQIHTRVLRPVNLR